MIDQETLDKNLQKLADWNKKCFGRQYQAEKDFEAQMKIDKLIQLGWKREEIELHRLYQFY